MARRQDTATPSKGLPCRRLTAGTRMAFRRKLADQPTGT
ncbi:unknown [Prevotella sp. CAG:1058]|nr:unknown [Prevotella sp. CAG:1058]